MTSHINNKRLTSSQCKFFPLPSITL